MKRLERKYHFTTVFGNKQYFVRELVPENAEQYAGPIQELLHESWNRRFVQTGLMSDEDLREKIDPRNEELVAAQAERISRIHELGGRYVVAMAVPEHNLRGPRLSGLAHVELYRPRDQHKNPYPNVRDLEALPVQPGPIAAHLLDEALRVYNPSVKVSLYSEEPNTAMNSWLMSRLGMVPGLRPKPEQIGSYEMQYVQFLGHSVSAARELAARAAGDLGRQTKTRT